MIQDTVLKCYINLLQLIVMVLTFIDNAPEVPNFFDPQQALQLKLFQLCLYLTINKVTETYHCKAPQAGGSYTGFNNCIFKLVI